MTVLTILFGVYLAVHILLLAVRTWLPHPKIRPLFCRIGWHSRQRDRKHLATSTTGLRYVRCGWCDHQGYETRFGDMEKLGPPLILLVITLVVSAPLWVGSLLRHFFSTSRVKQLCCRIGWHSPPGLWEPKGFDGLYAHAQCPWCGGVGLVDRHGNLLDCEQAKRSE